MKKNRGRKDKIEDVKDNNEMKQQSHVTTGTRQLRDRSRNKVEQEKVELVKEQEVKNEFKITLVSSLKNLIERLIENEIKKTYKKSDYHSNFKKQKNEFIYNFTFQNKILSDELIESISKSEMFKNSELKVYLNDEEIVLKEVQEEKMIENINQNVTDIKSEPLPNVTNIREICVLNIPEKLNNEKVYEIFFIFGDISQIEFAREEKKAYIKYKYCSSAQKAVKKLNSAKYQTKNLKVEFSDINQRTDQASDSESKGGRVVYLKYQESDRVPEKEAIKKILKKYGLVTKLFRKKEGKTYYIEFSSECSSEELMRDFQAGLFTSNGLAQVNYAYEKCGENVIEIGSINEAKVDENIQIASGVSGVIDPTKHWQVYFDPTYQMNYYFNPFFNQSVWELPLGAELTPYQQAQELFYDPQLENNVSNEEGTTHDIKPHHYDDEAWEEDELCEKLVWDKMREQQLKEWMKRPARKQVTDTRRDTAYIEGNYDYNIWYDKYLTDRKEEKEKIPALYKCNLALDTGYTRADKQEKEGGAYFCLFFAKGSCSEGVNCRYYHRVPQKDDTERIENLRDVFGRSRFAAHRVDMGGVGSFTRECRSLFITDLKMLETPNPVKEMVKIIYENFSPWGEIEDINYIPAKATCFIRFAHRIFAEFGKEAMIGQSLVGEEILTVKWAYDDPNPMSKKRTEKENENRFLSAYNSKQDNLKNLNQRDKNRSTPNSDYKNFYNSRNNPYDYSSGYGNENQMQGGNINKASDQPKSDYLKLTETLKMIDEMNNDMSNEHNEQENN